ncbi:MAG: glycoside hydrolase family 44 [Fibrobacteria bacterium]|nr:glycoside hydrolase family 44 [Fibrobacteria bacterium]
MKILQIVLLSLVAASANVRIVVDADSGRIPISPWIFGRNNSVGSQDKATGLSELVLGREAGVRMWRENGGNNSTKYNWRNGLSSHPDWFNNVYDNDWDGQAKSFQDSAGAGTQALFAFQLLGWVAGNTSHNWGDWAWSQAHGGTYPDASFDLAGGGSVDATGETETSKGDPSSYLVSWGPDSTAGILGHWFDPGGLGLDSSRFLYWNMDNEPDIWSATHDDIQTDTLGFEEFLARYVGVALAVRSRKPWVRLVGPVLTNEWQWWTWNNSAIQAEGRSWSPMEYFLKRIGEEEKRTGTKLLDVFDLHAYPGYGTAGEAEEALQFHRMFYDTTYPWPKSNGIHMFDGKWKTAVVNRLFGRVEGWMLQYLGEKRGLGISEFGAVSLGGDAASRALVYASLLGTFADHGVELFCPWDWHPEWWEVLHLWSRYSGGVRVSARSSSDSLVSGYASLAGSDTMAVILVNRDSKAQPTSLRIRGARAGAMAHLRSLADFSPGTFRSHRENALVSSELPVVSDSVHLELPARSMAVLRVPIQVSTRASRATQETRSFSVAQSRVLAPGRRIEILAPDGRAVLSGTGTLDLAVLPRGIYRIRVDEESMPFLRL